MSEALQDPVTPTILCVDDEQAILASLKRTLRGAGNILTAESGAEALAILEQRPVDVVITDMRMPGMTGADLLKAITDNGWNPARILLTGFADLDLLALAVNDGRVNRYLRKPWDSDELLSTVRQELHRRHLEQENERLSAEVQRQNDALRELNASLEDKVRERTAALRESLQKLEESHRQTQDAHRATTRVFYNLLSLNNINGGKQAILIGKLAALIAGQLNLPKEEIGQIRLAGILCDLGLLCMDTELRNKPWYELSRTQRQEYLRHPELAVQAMTPATHLQAAAQAIKHQFERFDGKGVPDQLSGEAVPLSSRILAVARDYVRTMDGILQKGKQTSFTAFKSLEQAAQHIYDPQVTAALLDVIPLINTEMVAADEQVMSTAHLRAGMVLSRDLFNSRSILLLPKGQTLNEAMIKRLLQVEVADSRFLEVYVNR